MGGKTRKKTDWKAYNKQLIKRGEFHINPKFLHTWDEEIKEMNYRKELRESLILMLGLAQS